MIWAAISAHGFGHAAQVVPVLNALGQIVPDLRVILRTTVSASFFKNRLVIPWELSAVQQDIGCIQDDPLTIDVEANWREHERFHGTWNDRLQQEVTAMKAARPDVVLADTPYLALAAGKAAAIPTVALANFTWDLILSYFVAPPSIDKAGLLHSIRQSYAQADVALRIIPAPKIDVFQRVNDISPIAEPAAPAHRQLAAVLALSPYFLMLYVFNCWNTSTPEAAAHSTSLFQTGWFVESLLTQTLIIHIIRTNKIPFLQSRPSWPLLVMSSVIMATGIALPFSPLRDYLGFTPLPLLYWPQLALTLVCYVVLTQLVKMW